MSIFDKLFAARKTKQDPYVGGLAHGHSNSSVFNFIRLPTSKVVVNETKALEYSAVFAAVRVISDGLSCHPWNVIEETGDDMRVVHTEHPVHRIIHSRPNPEMSSKTFRQTLCSNALLWGNAYAEIERNQRGDVIALWPLDPSRMILTRANTTRRELVYEYSGNVHKTVRLRPRDVLHIKGMSFDGIIGYSPITLARESVGLGLAAEYFGAAFFGNDARPSVVFKHPTELGPDEEKNLRQSVERMFGGSKKSWRPIVLEGGMDIDTITMPLQDAQFLETRKFQVTEIARWFRVPPHMIGDLERATFTNIEAQDRQYIRDCLQNWVVTFEEEANFKLFPEAERGRFTTKFDLKELKRGDIKSRTAHYKAMFGMGVYSIDEIRAEEGKNPLPNKQGELRLVPMNMQPIDQAGSAPAQRRQPGAPPNALRDVIADVFSRAIRKESKACTAKMDKFASRQDCANWAISFYATHADQLAENLSPVCRALGKMSEVGIPVDEIEGLINSAEAFALAHCDRSVEVIADAWEAGKLDENFLELREHFIVDELSDKFVELLQTEVYDNAII